MNHYLLADQILQYVLNALTAFLLFSFFSEMVLRLFNIQHARVRASFRLIPAFRLLLEPILWLFPSAPTIVNLSIFSCSHPIQYYFYGLLPEETKVELSLYSLKTVSGSFFLMVPGALVLSVVILFVCMTLFRLTVMIVQHACAIYQIKKIQGRGVSDLRQIFNPILRNRLLKKRTAILFSDEVQVPFAGWGNIIIVPKELAGELTQDEFESVIAHELEHHCCYDNFVRMFYHLITAIHWWVPMETWLHKIEHDQELACDSSIHCYEYEGLSLANALKKTMMKQQIYQFKCAAFSRITPYNAKKAALIRIQAVLNYSELHKQNRFRFLMAGGVLLALILSISFVIC